MLNGNKSYLLSITALFSKKGYGLMLGLNHLVDINNQYLLTAPVNGTYKAFIEENSKSARKTPGSATGAFGKSIAASFALEPEGIGLETVKATVVSYLNDVHGFLSADYSTQRSPIADQGVPVTMHLKDHLEAERDTKTDGWLRKRLDAETESYVNARDRHLHAASGGFERARAKIEEIDEKVFSAGRLVTDVLDMPRVVRYADAYKVIAESWEPSGEILADERQKVAYGPGALRNAVNISKDYEDGARIEKWIDGKRDDFFQGGVEIIKHSHAKRLNEIADGAAADFMSKGSKRERAMGAKAQGLAGGDFTAPPSEAIFEWLHPAGEKEIEASPAQQFSDTHPNTAGLAEISRYTSSETGSGDKSQYSYLTGADSRSGADGRMNGDEFAQNIKHLVAGDSEVTKVARLLEIMYGSEVFQHIEAGIEDIVHSATQGGLSEAAVSMIRNSVLDQIRESAGGNKTDADMFNTETAESGGGVQLVRHSIQQSQFGARNEAIEHAAEQGYSQSPFAGIMATPVFGNMSGSGKELFVHDMGKAIADANSKLAKRNRPELAESKAHWNGTMENHGFGDYQDRFGNYDAQQTEVAQYRDYFTYQNENDMAKASYVTEFDAIGREHEMALDRDRELESVVFGDTQASKSSNYDAKNEFIPSANGLTFSWDAILHETERSEGAFPEDESFLHRHHTANWAESGEAVLHDMDKSQGDSVLDAVQHGDGSTHFGDAIMLAALEQLDNGGSETLHGAVTQPIENAESVASTGGGEAASTIMAESLKPTSGADDDGLISAARQRKRLGTDIQEVDSAGRNRVVVETDIEDAGHAAYRRRIVHETAMSYSSHSKRIKETIETTIGEGQGGRRHKVVETDIAGAEEGVLKSHPESKKARLWLIMGKIASWNIWNWKKTR